jgi:3',5'-cyclic-AMP phosphodiesterase
MPLHLLPMTRRRFLAQSATATAALLTLGRLPTRAAATDPHSFALLADTHIPSDPATVARGVNMSDHLEQVAGQLRALKVKPAGVIINGDCAYIRGLADDYRNLERLIAPIGEAGMPLHLTMGNHDDLDVMYDIMAAHRPGKPLVAGKHVTVLETPRANFFLLDSLWQVNVVTGEIGGAQLDWLAKALAAHTDKPAIVVAHHNLQWDVATAERVSGLRDTDALFELLVSNKHVKAYIFGHRHRWELHEREGLHLINLPAVAYVFAEHMPSGWVHATLKPDGIQLNPVCLDPDHPDHGQGVRLKWRAG